MSFGAVRDDFWQSTARGTISEKCKSIFNQELLSDVKFVVRESQGGSESKKIPAHKFVLAISSPVFFAMFYGELAETKDSVEITDCEYESLLEMFRFIYSDEANLNPDNVMQVTYLAKIYMLPSLVDRCSAYLQKNLNASNVFHVLLAAQKYEEKELLDHCWKVIEIVTEEAVKSDGFAKMERSVLEELVEKDSLNIKEVELFKAVDYWAEKECEKQGLSVEGTVKRRILGERIVKGIRFPVMEQKEFVEFVLDSDILSQKETYGLMKYFNSVAKTPLGFSEAKRVGHLKMISRFRSLKSGLNNISGGNYYILRLFGSEKYEYLVNLTLQDVTGVAVAKKAGNFLSKLIQSEKEKYQGFEIVFYPPIALQENKRYFLRAQITGPSCCGVCGQSSVEHSGVKFQFFNYNKTTEVEKGQFSEFMFTVS